MCFLSWTLRPLRKATTAIKPEEGATCNKGMDMRSSGTVICYWFEKNRMFIGCGGDRLDFCSFRS